MRTLLCGLFSLMLVGSATMLTATDVFADPGGNGNGNAYGLNGGNGNGNAYGLNGGNGNGGQPHAVPIPETLLLFGAGFAGFAAWRSKNHIPR